MRGLEWGRLYEEYHGKSYDPKAMASCPYAGIIEYLGKEDVKTMGIPGAKITHIWTDDPADAPLVAAASLIPNVVDKPEDVIGKGDAVMVASGS